MADRNGWQDVLLEDIAAPSRNAIVGGPFGSDLVSSDYSSEGIPVIRGENLSLGRWVGGDFVFVPPAKAQQLSANTAGPLDIVFTQRGANHYRQVAMIPRDANSRFVISQSQMKLTVDVEKADPLFVYYLFRSPQQQEYLQRNAIQTGVPHTNLSILRRTPVQIPQLSVQRAIVQVLGALDDKIELNQLMNDTLEATARAIFKDWVVDFGPTRAKTEGRTPYLVPEIWALFPDRLDDTGKPEGWQLTVIEDVLDELETGGRPKGGVSGYTYGVPSVGAESIVGLGKFDYAKTKYIPKEFFDGMNKGHVKSRDVLLYKDGGRPGEFEPHLTLVGDGFPFDTFAINEHVYRLRAKPDFGQALLYFWLSSDLAMEEMRIKGTGVAIPGLNSTQVKTLTTLVPTPDVTRSFDIFVEPMISRILANCNEAQSLAKMRNLLLPKLMSGEIRMREAEKEVQAVA
jgi:type I restriction enzyme, S subunit